MVIASAFATGLGLSRVKSPSNSDISSDPSILALAKELKSVFGGVAVDQNRKYAAVWFKCPSYRRHHPQQTPTQVVAEAVSRLTIVVSKKGVGAELSDGESAVRRAWRSLPIAFIAAGLNRSTALSQRLHPSVQPSRLQDSCCCCPYACSVPGKAYTLVLVLAGIG